MAMIVAGVENISRYGEVTLRADGCVEAFHEKQAVERSGWINAGVYCLPGDVFTDYTGPQSFSFEQSVMPKLTQKGLATVPASGPFIDMGIPEDYQLLASQPSHYFSSLPIWKAEAEESGV